MVGLGLSLVGLLGGSGGLACVVNGGTVGLLGWSGGSACVVDGGSMRFFLVLSWLIFFFFFSFINCAGVLGFHSGDGGDERERERHKYILFCKYIILMYCIRK